jgi:hypothetical protein
MPEQSSGALIVHHPDAEYFTVRTPGWAVDRRRDGCDDVEVGASPALPIEPEAHGVCVGCQGPLGEAYYLGDGPQCEHCATGSESSGRGRLVDACVEGMLAVVAMAVIWVAVIQLTDREFGLLGIIAGVAIGGAIRHGAGASRHPGFSWMAAGLTYLAINLGAVGFLLTSDLAPSVSAGGLLLAVVAWPFLKLAADAESGIVGLVILAFSLQTAWRVATRPTTGGRYSLVRGGPNPSGHQLCRGCGAGMPESALVCPGCGALVHGEALMEHVARGRAAEDAGDTQGAITALREAKKLLPPISRNETRISAEIERLSSASNH